MSTRWMALIGHEIPQRRIPRRIPLIVVVVAVIYGVGFWIFFLPRLASGAYLSPGGGAIVGQSHIAPGDVVSFDVPIGNESDQTITLQSISFPRGLPAHVRLIRAKVSAAEEPEWHPLTGFHLAPHYHD